MGNLNVQTNIRWTSKDQNTKQRDPLKSYEGRSFHQWMKGHSAETTLRTTEHI